MTDAIDNIKDADDALAYTEAAGHGIVRSLNEVHRLLKEVHRRTDDELTLLLVEQAMLKVEAQLDY
jgi:hypothetical protein